MDHGHFTKIDKDKGVNLFYCADHHATNRVKGYGARTLLKLWEELGANEIKICEHYEEKAIHGQVVNATEIEGFTQREVDRARAARRFTMILMLNQ